MDGYVNGWEQVASPGKAIDKWSPYCFSKLRLYVEVCPTSRVCAIDRTRSPQYISFPSISNIFINVWILKSQLHIVRWSEFFNVYVYRKKKLFLHMSKSSVFSHKTKIKIKKKSYLVVHLVWRYKGSCNLRKSAILKGGVFMWHRL